METVTFYVLVQQDLPDREACNVSQVCRSEVHFQPAHDTATDTEWQLPEAVLTQFVSPDDEHDLLEHVES